MVHAHRSAARWGCSARGAGPRASRRALSHRSSSSGRIGFSFNSDRSDSSYRYASAIPGPRASKFAAASRSRRSAAVTFPSACAAMTNTRRNSWCAPMRQVGAARDAGALPELPLALSTRVGVCLFGGEITAAAHLIRGIGLAPRRTGAHQLRDRRAAVHQPEHRGVPPREGVPEAGREVTDAARTLVGQVNALTKTTL